MHRASYRFVITRLLLGWAHTPDENLSAASQPGTPPTAAPSSPPVPARVTSPVSSNSASLTDSELKQRVAQVCRHHTCAQFILVAIYIRNCRAYFLDEHWYWQVYHTSSDACLVQSSQSHGGILLNKLCLFTQFSRNTKEF